MNREAAEKIAVAAYRAGMKNGIREYAVWKDGEQLVGVMRRPLREVLAQVDAVSDVMVRSAACSDPVTDEAIQDALDG